jgi:hypothetical protein
MVPDLLLRVVANIRCRMFDWRHNVRTCGVASLDGLTITGDNANHGVFFYPSHPKFLAEVCSKLDIDYTRYAFIDLGSGKGGPLLVASLFPFSEIVGLNSQKSYTKLPPENIRTFRSSSQKCKNIKKRLRRRQYLQIPPNPTVLFMFNPFSTAVLSEVLRNLQKSLEAHPRDVIMIYSTISR